MVELGAGYPLVIEKERTFMKKIAMAAVFALAAANLSAGGMDEPEMGKMAEPMMEPEVMEPEADNTLMIPMLLLILAGALALN